MEVKINREIRNYTESMFFGLSLRQFVFSLLAVGVAVLLYFVLKPHVGTETVSWMCILGAAPFAAMGFVTYNGMTAEQFVWAWLRSEMLEPKQIKFEPVNIYYEALKDAIDEHEKEVSKHAYICVLPRIKRAFPLCFAVIRPILRYESSRSFLCATAFRATCPQTAGRRNCLSQCPPSSRFSPQCQGQKTHGFVASCAIL